jgi:fructose-specific phosphotransferase system IIC component
MTSSEFSIGILVSGKECLHLLPMILSTWGVSAAVLFVVGVIGLFLIAIIFAYYNDYKKQPAYYASVFAFLTIFILGVLVIFFIVAKLLGYPTIAWILISVWLTWVIKSDKK